MSKKRSPLPNMEDLVSYLQDNSGRVGKREIARAFNIRGDDRIALKEMLREMENSGVISKGNRRSISMAGVLPQTCPVEVTGEDSDGYLIARPLNWHEDTPSPQIILIDMGNIIPAAKLGDFLLVRVKQAGKNLYEGTVVRRLTNAPDRIVGVFSSRGKGQPGMVCSVDRRLKHNFFVERDDTLNAEDSSIVIAELFGEANRRQAKVIKIIGKETDSNVASLIAVYLHNLPLYFPSAAIKEAEKAILPPMDNREDLRSLPLVTIDGEDARDFDDAVWAEPYSDGKIKNGWHLIVAIADVAWFVRSGSALDASAKERGNSVYFPDQAIHMLPQELSAGLSSLMPNEDRPCLAVHIWIDGEGKQIKKKFTRAMIRSVARLNYHEVQDIIDGRIHSEHLESLINNLYEAFKVLDYDRKSRGALNIDAVEREIILTSSGKVSSIIPRERLESHQIIEEFMIAANVAAAEVLEELEMPVMYRIHEPPSGEKIAALSDYLSLMKVPVKLPAKPKPADFNKILAEVKDTPLETNINEMVLRSQSQARYSPENYGHFGLALEKYAHFTSPIRRYADLMVHRALISGLNLGEGGLDLKTDITKTFTETAEHISYTERRADTAERDAEDRYIAAFLAPKEGELFSGIVTGVTPAGLFIRLDDNYAEGFSPISTLPDEYYVYDGIAQKLVGQSTGMSFSLGQEVQVILKEAVPLTGGILLEVLGKVRRKHRPPRHRGRLHESRRKSSKQGHRRARHHH
ncbi:MAG: ribonuclease R [Alphaproteobacteria bacterium]|nr:ribonuclease R [Alphaproteobacteria bacterium]